jgi:DNA-binding NtrC family response regulator
VVITDLRMPGMDGLELIRQLRRLRPRLPVLLMTAHGTTETAIEATKLGAYDYLLKPFEMEELLELTARAVAGSKLMSDTVTLGNGAPSPKEALIGNSRAMQQVYKEIGRVAGTTIPVLIRGETGTGKELVARALYQHSDRSSEPFIAVNCAAIPETLLESELFGHERGAFTGAEARRIGRFEQAHDGTLFLDEIGDMTPGTQAKLLRVLQDKVIQRVGGRDDIPMTARIITATHRDLETAIVEKQFREDLFYRLNGVTIALPPLRERSSDIPELAAHFLQKCAAENGTPVQAMMPEALKFLQTQRWPGNVRELGNTVRKAMLQARGRTITLEDVQSVVNEKLATSAPAGQQQPMREYIAQLLGAAQRGEVDHVHAAFFAAAEKELLTQAMALAGGNKTKAAQWLGMTRLTLREKLAALEGA